jgi:L-threonylcarbamoyladenylate synthase
MNQEGERSTLVLRVDAENPDPEKIKQAAAVIKKGGLVAFPTDTFYGLGADALNPEAVAAVFRAKKRNSDKPLIVLAKDVPMVMKLTKVLPVEALQLMSKFWPGPLSLIFEARPGLPPKLLGEGKTLAIRIPANKIALRLLEEADCPLTAPSANLEGKPNPLLPLQVLTDLYGQIDLLLDGGPCASYYPSTLVDVTTSPPTLLREGAIKKEQLLTLMPIKMKT